MKKYLTFLLCILLLLSSSVLPDASAAFTGEPPVKTKNTTDNFSYAPDRVIVKLKRAKAGLTAYISACSAASFPFPDLGIETEDIKLINPSNTSSIANKDVALCAAQDDTQNNTFVVILKNPSTENVQNALEILRSNPDVEYAVPDSILKICGTAPNDEKYTSKAYRSLDAIKARQAWDITTGSKKIVVGIIDSGIDGNHEDLKDNLWVNPNPNQGGYKNDLHGYDFINHCGGTPTDANGHGTHVAGIVGAKGNNGIGVCGVNWNVQLAWLKVGDEEGNIQVSHAVEAINYAKNHHIPIINASWCGHPFNGGSEFVPLEEAIKNYDGLFVAAAGNDDACIDNYTCYPACFDLPNIITVGASQGDGYNSDLTNGVKDGYSNYGDGVDLVAPGTDILSTLPGNSYGEFSGTSMATPMVAGVAALVMAKHPDYTAVQVKNAILNGTVKNGMFLKYCIANGATLNAYGALLETKPAPQRLEIGPTNSVTVEAGQTMLLYTHLFPTEANQNVVWTSSDTNVVTMNADGSYVAVSPGKAKITATSVENPTLTQSIPITVTPAVSPVANFTDENFKSAYIHSVNRASTQYKNGIRYLKSKIYLSETYNETWLEFRGTDLHSLDDLKYFPNLENLVFQGVVLTGTLDLTGLRKLEQLSISSIMQGKQEYTYTEGTYAYDLKGVKAIIGGHTIEAQVTGQGFMHVDWKKPNYTDQSMVDVFFEDYHRPAHATLNGESLYPFEMFVSHFYFDCNRPSLINIEVQPGVDISDPRVFQAIANQLKKTEPLGYRFYNWQDGYTINESDFANWSRYKPLCKYDLEKLGLNSNLSINSSRYNISGGYIGKIPIGTTVGALLNGVNEKAYCKVYKGNAEVRGTALVGTGMKEKLIIGNTVIKELSVVVTGDINGDGGVSITDMLEIKADLLKKSRLSGAAAKAADTNGDGGISITDFIQTKSHILGKSKLQAR